MFVHDLRVTLRDTDAAAIVFFARYFDLAHMAYEAFLEAHGLPLRDLIEASPHLFPIVHADADYRQPLKVGDAVRIELAAEQVGSRSFTLHYRLLKADGTLAATVRTVHAVIERATWKSTSLPERLRSALHSVQNDDSIATGSP